MGHLLGSTASNLKKSQCISALKFAIVALGVNSSAALSHDLAQVVTGAISNSIVGQVLPSVPSVAATSSGGLCLNFITTQIAADMTSALLVVLLGVILKARGGGFLTRGVGWLGPSALA